MRAIRFSRAPGRLDVMGGIADYTGSLVLQATLDRATAVALQDRDDRLVCIHSLNLRDENISWSYRTGLDELAALSIEQLAGRFKERRVRWAGYLAGCLRILHERKLVDLQSPLRKGLNLAVLGTVPLGAGVSSSASVEVATMINVCAHFGLAGNTVDAVSLAAMCQEVENRIVGAPCGIMDQVASALGECDSLLRMLCQPHELQPPLRFPRGVRAVGIDSRVKHSVGGGMYGKTRCAAFMGHRIIVEKMRQMGDAAGKTLDGDPMRGYLANLPADDYKKYFRPFLPESMDGRKFIDQYAGTIDGATAVDPQVAYHVQSATDHHVLESQRVRNFAAFLEQAEQMPQRRENLLNKAGHLMYASHQSYTNAAGLGAEECDLLVKLVRQRESGGLYGAKITGGGCGGTVAVLCDCGQRADQAISDVMTEYHRQTGREPQAFLASSPGAWHAGTVEIAAS